MQPDSVTVIIATSGRPDALRRTLASLSNSVTHNGGPAELLLAENGQSSDASGAAARLDPKRFSVRILRSSIGNKSMALNQAIDAATGSAVVFTDDDVVFPPDWLRQMCKPIWAREAEVVAGGCRLAPKLVRPWMSRLHRACLASTEYLDDDNPSEFAGVSFACARSVFESGIRFDPELGGGALGNCEDVLLARQLKAAGFRFASRTRLHLEHHPSESRLNYESWVRAAEAIGRSRAYLEHHWSYVRLSFPALRSHYLLLKLVLRRKLSGTPKSEGIPAWELSYRIDIARYRAIQRLKNRPRNYARNGLLKLALHSSFSTL